MKHTLLLFTLLSLLLSACAPQVIAGSSGEMPTPAIVEQTEAPPVAAETAEPLPNQGYQPVAIVNVEVEVGVGSPLPVHVIASGDLPNSCAQVELVQLQQDGSTFQITVSTSALPLEGEGCIQDSLPFKIGIPLNVIELPSGTYVVEVNGVSQSFELNSGNAGSALPAGGDAVVKDDIQVDGVSIDAGVGSPIPVHAVVSLSQPGTCAQLGEVRLQREGSTFYVRLIAASPAAGECTADNIPFRAEIPLNITNLPAGPYEVNVNGAIAGFELPFGPTSGGALEAFEAALQAALLARDPQQIRGLMGEEFVFAYYMSEGMSYPADEAVSQLLENHAGPGGHITLHAFQNIPGFDPQMSLHPDVTLAKAIFASGWGADGREQALLLVAQREDGTLYWHSALVVPAGFAPPMGAVACSDPVEVPYLDGAFSYNGISFQMDPAIARPMAARTCPEAPARGDQGPYEVHPPYTEFFLPAFERQNVDYQPSVRIYKLAGDLSGYTFPLNSVPELQAFLAQGGGGEGWFKAPLTARQQVLSFAGGSGVRCLVQYMQDFFFFSNNGLLYEFHGLTDNGRSFVQVRYPVSVPFLMELGNPSLLPPDNLNPGAIAVPEWPSDFDGQRKVIEAYNGEALSRLEAMQDGEAQPDLALLDALVQSLVIQD